MRKKLFKTLVVITAMVGVLSTGMVAFAAENYTVQNGDYLKKIAKQVYNDEAKWEVIYEANKDTIKNPNLIYEGQVFVIPDLTDNENLPVTTETATEQETSATTAEAAPATATPSAPIKNVPVGANPDTSHTGEHWYSLKSGNIIICEIGTIGYMSETTDMYGVTYREYKEGANAIMMNKVADFIAQNPSSGFAELVTQSGNEVVIITGINGGIYLKYTDGTLGTPGWVYGVVDCDPEDCVYFFAPFAEEDWNDMFSDIG